MKIKEVKRTANIAWSPASQHPILLAAGTAAQQLDATFSTSAALELFEVDLTNTNSRELKCVASIDSDCRFHKLVWGGGLDTADNGLLVGGADGGNIYVWDMHKMLQQSSPEDILFKKLDKHVGSVTALDFNPYQGGLLASGGSDSDIYIWDLNRCDDPLTPGSKSSPPDDVTCVAWNKQVQHILASTYAGRCVIWDLKKNEPIIKVSDSMSRIKCKQIAWHPDIATQICLASEDDHTPVIQVWDLRFATSPVKILENHQRGILSMSWCQHDSDLLLTCGKDNRILCWNPNSTAQSGEVVFELPTSNQWSFDVEWCPRNPNMISNCSFDGQISIYSLLGGNKPPITPTQKVSDSFPSDPFSQTNQVTHAHSNSEAIQMLTKPPKWLRRPVGATFGFGGKLIKFSEPPSNNGQQQQQQQGIADVIPRVVEISQVITEPELLSRSHQLEEALSSGAYLQYCQGQITNCKTDHDEQLWNFLKVHFENNPRTKYLELLGYDQNILSKKISNCTGQQVEVNKPKNNDIDAGELAKEMAKLETSTDSSGGDSSSAFDQIAQTSDMTVDEPLSIAVGDEYSGLLTRSLLLGNFDAAVEVCLHNNKMAEAIILSIAGGPELLNKTQNRFFKSKANDNTIRLIMAVVCRDFESIVRNCELENWKEALAIILTYAKPEQFATLCDILGSRLECCKDDNYCNDALLLYICAGNVDKLISCLTRLQQDTPDMLQAMIEKVMILRKANDIANNRNMATPLNHTDNGRLNDMNNSEEKLVEKLTEYSKLLASQGNLLTALNYLGGAPNEADILVMRHRLTCALGNDIPGVAQVEPPFDCIDVRPEGQYQQQQQQLQQPQQTTSTVGQQIQQRRLLQEQKKQQQHQPSYQPRPTTPNTTTRQPSPYAGLPNTASTGGNVGDINPALAASGNNYSSSTGTINPAAGATTYQPQPTPVQKGPLSRKYPTAAYAQSQPNQPLYNNPYQPQPNSQPGMQPGMQPIDLNASYGSGSLNSSSQQPSVFNPAQQMSQTPGAPTQPTPPSMPSFQDVRPQKAWNDPPVVSSQSKKKQPTEYVAPEPITAPIYGVPQPEQGPPGAPSYNPNMYNGNQPQQHYGSHMQQTLQQTQQQTQVTQQRVATPPPQPPVVDKLPIPPEHQILHDSFNQLTKQCLNAKINAQTKRKLEDVERKLEYLYDKLRESRLSPNVVQSLHNICASIKQYDYHGCLQIHSELISQGNFSEICSFMPSIKVLIQTANQLQIYIQ